MAAMKMSRAKIWGRVRVAVSTDPTDSHRACTARCQLDRCVRGQYRLLWLPYVEASRLCRWLANGGDEQRGVAEDAARVAFDNVTSDPIELTRDLH